MTFKYVEKDTIIHKLHPMTKALLLLAALMLALIFTYDYSIVPLLIVLAFELIIWRVAGIEFWRVAIVIKVLLGIFLFFIIVQGFLYRGGVTPLFGDRSLQALGEGYRGVHTRGPSIRSLHIR